MHNKLTIIIGVLAAIIVGGLIIFFLLRNLRDRNGFLQSSKQETMNLPSVVSKSSPEVPKGTENKNDNGFSLPLDRAAERISKKKFGTFVTPQNSPVSPERFSGYHTGVDFETFPDEGDRDLEVHAICRGEILLKQLASGYGGVVVQSCKLSSGPITVVYGHVKLSSVNRNVSEMLTPGDAIGILGKGETNETDGERKHLHLGIHKGGEANIRGYVSSPDQFSDWIDPCTVLICN